MQLWETRTLPMRLAFSRYPWRGHREIEAVTPKPLAFSPPPLCEGVIAACIQASLGKTSLVRGDKKDLAARLENLGKICTSLAKSGPQADVEGAVSHWVRGLELCDRISLECKALYYPDSASVWLESDKEQQRFASLLMPPVLPYPAELRIAQWHARKKDWPACLSICDAGLRRFPNHAALLVLRQQAAHPDRKASASKKDVSRPKSKKKHSGSKTPKSGKSTQRLSNHSPK